MKIINNITDKLSDELKEKLEPGSKLSIAAACFSVYAFEELKTQLEGIDALRFIFTSPTFLAEQPEKAQREFYIPRLNREKTLYGSEFEIRLRNEFTQKAISRECAEWVRRKALFKSNVTSELMPGFMTVENAAPCAFAPVNGFTRADLGCERGGNMFSMINEIDAPESAAYRKGIKVLSLFFIDEVSKYRSYDGDDDTGRNGEYAQMFEEEYNSVVSELQRKIGDESYLRYLDKLSARTTHQGYFSIDKKKGKKARFVESKVDRKTQTSDDADAYDLIMKDKERLLSLDEPVRFIFSHSALREGWDNPNVFQICTLKKQSDSDIRSRQEIGRGLRLCVDQQGERMDESVLGSEVQELNKLTLITDMEFGKFAEALQSGLAESLADRPKKVDTQLFLGKVLTDANGSEVKVTPELATAIYEDLVSNGYVKRGELTDKYYADKASGTVQVAEEVKDCTAAVVQVLSSIYDSHSMRPEDAHGNNVEARIDPEKLHKKEFVELWNRINHKSFYTVRFDKEKLIENAVQMLDEKLNVTTVTVKLEYGEQAAHLDSKEQLEQGHGFRRTLSDQEAPKTAPLGSVRYDLIGKLVEETKLTRATIAAILQRMASQKFAMFRLNPEEFILKTAKIINDQMATQIIEHITYNKLDAAYDTDIFTSANLRGKLGLNAMEANRSLYSHIIYDSENEKQFAGELDVNAKVAVYVKLPGGFFISTPVGKYNPDWAIAFNEGSVKHIYFIVETKGNSDAAELRGVENAKIACAKAHFAAISSESVTYSVVDSFAELMNIVS